MPDQPIKTSTSTDQQSSFEPGQGARSVEQDRPLSEAGTVKVAEANPAQPPVANRPMYKLGFWRGLFSNSEEF